MARKVFPLLGCCLMRAFICARTSSSIWAMKSAPHIVNLCARNSGAIDRANILICFLFNRCIFLNFAGDYPPAFNWFRRTWFDVVQWIPPAATVERAARFDLVVVASGPPCAPRVPERRADCRKSHQHRRAATRAD